ncbi:uncharacterized protein LOC124322567 [Daphnia pulicaria]|uniref:uncharacterized protein LOC124322567 n=1 Tax=Daphnia pulicaria TaxID=35523 RepID=UPI001EEB6E97|nr:uncharacterized protein LOC124322567 [Daphnia pulicaria]
MCLTGYYYSENGPGKLSSDRSLPITVNILFAVNSYGTFIQLLLSRWIVMRYRRLQVAVEAVQEVEGLLGEKFLAQHKSSLTTRFFIGFTIILTVTMGSTIVVMPLVPSVLPENPSAVLVAIILFLLALIIILIECTPLLIYLCYYIISHYMQMILLHSETDRAEDQRNLIGAENLKILRRNALIFDHLCHASSELNHIFSVPVLILLIMKFVSVISTSFFSIYYFVHRTDVLENYSLFFPFTFFTEGTRILILLFAADMPVNQVCFLRERLIRMSHSRFYRTSAEKIAVMTVLMQIDEGRVRLSAAGLFDVGVNLIPAVSASSFT